MARVYVCPLSRVEEVVTTTGAEALVSLLSPPHGVWRPASIAAERHLALGVSDIVGAQDGQVLAQEAHVERLLAFLDRWERARPLVIHCYAGISRSPAAAFVSLCALTSRPEIEIAKNLRRLSPSATPNARLVALGDAVLARQGRMVAAIESIGRGVESSEGEVFCMELA